MMHAAIPRKRLILFGRYPVPGKTKTRLIPSLGRLGAAEVQRFLTERTWDTLLQSGVAPVDFAYTGAGEAQVRRWIGDVPVHPILQSAGDLGQRMQAALKSAMARGARQVVLVGTDIPALTTCHIAKAFAALEQHDVVLGPSRDGGYWLVGCRRPADVFSNIDWGGPQVLRQTLAAAERCALSVALLDDAVLDDLDTETDLKAWQPAQAWRGPFITVVIPALNEAHAIAGALARLSAAAGDVEIIVADGGSQDGTRAVARRSGAAVIDAPRGRAAQQNAGAAQARGRVLLFLHADTRLPDNFADQVFELLMDPRVVLGAFRFKSDWDCRSMHWLEQAVQLRCWLFHLPYGDQAFFLRKPLFEQVGGFPAVPIAEDLLLLRRLAHKGRIALAPGAVVTSSRRWRSSGILRLTLIHALIAGGCLLGVDPVKLAPLRRRSLPAGAHHTSRRVGPNQREP